MSKNQLVLRLGTIVVGVDDVERAQTPPDAHPRVHLDLVVDDADEQARQPWLRSVVRAPVR